VKSKTPASPKKDRRPPAAHAVVLSPRDAADRYGLSVPTLYRMARRGELRMAKIGSRTLIRVADLDALLDDTSARIS
jgi:excisionase family DNA binding protein